MTLRCKSCQATVWLRAADAETPASSATCRSCNQRYDLEGVRRLLTKGDKLAVAARALAKDSAIDLPGAYSVLLGIMTVSEVKELGNDASPACHTVSPDGEDAESGRKHYDRAFTEAVEAGLLTPAQATERGRRDTYARTLAQKHRLPHEVALAVTDNRLSLLEAIRRHRVHRGGPVQVSVQRGAVPRAAVAVAALASLLVIAWLSVREGRQQSWHTLSTQRVGSAVVRLDTKGRVFEVRGPGPRAVLDAYCESSARSCRALEIAPAAAASEARARLGLLVDPAAPERLLAITIVEDRDSNLWIAGDESSPLIAQVAPPGAAIAAHGRSGKRAPSPKPDAEPPPINPNTSPAPTLAGG